jgi:adenosylmethionine-8-amino-7-oxononanoate aminotransferase
MKKTVARLSVFVYDCRGDGCMFAIEAERGDEKRCIFASEAVQVVQE